MCVAQLYFFAEASTLAGESFCWARFRAKSSSNLVFDISLHDYCGLLAQAYILYIIHVFAADVSSAQDFAVV